MQLAVGDLAGDMEADKEELAVQKSEFNKQLSWQVTVGYFKVLLGLIVISLSGFLYTRSMQGIAKAFPNAAGGTGSTISSCIMRRHN